MRRHHDRQTLMLRSHFSNEFSSGSRILLKLVKKGGHRAAPQASRVMPPPGKIYGVAHNTINSLILLTLSASDTTIVTVTGNA